MEFLPYPHLIPTLFNGCGSGPPRNFTSASSWTWIGHPVSGLPVLTLRPFETWFPFGSMAVPFNLASTGNSPDRSTKSTRLHLNVLPQLVNTGFQVLFHSPPGVLFTFPSQYYALSVTKEYLALEGGPSDFPQGFSCLAVLWILPLPTVFMYGAFTLSGRLSQNRSAKLVESIPRSEPQHARTLVWALPFSLAATHRITCCFLFLRLLRCFSSPGSLHNAMYLRYGD